eukprot:GHVU01131218.1.p2 GENE.GHVU01131218.1~~GHVU01131218.1.p2  ORF type:complete len:255 (-),score=28.06 GHVU01131218.1:290-1054(-)
MRFTQLLCFRGRPTGSPPTSWQVHCHRLRRGCGRPHPQARQCWLQRTRLRCWHALITRKPPVFYQPRGPPTLTATVPPVLPDHLTLLPLEAVAGRHTAATTLTVPLEAVAGRHTAATTIGARQPLAAATPTLFSPPVVAGTANSSSGKKRPRRTVADQQRYVLDEEADLIHVRKRVLLKVEHLVDRLLGLPACCCHAPQSHVASSPASAEVTTSIAAALSVAVAAIESEADFGPGAANPQSAENAAAAHSNTIE